MLLAMGAEGNGGMLGGEPQVGSDSRGGVSSLHDWLVPFMRWGWRSRLVGRELEQFEVPARHPKGDAEGAGRTWVWSSGERSGGEMWGYQGSEGKEPRRGELLEKRDHSREDGLGQNPREHQDVSQTEEQARGGKSW